MFLRSLESQNPACGKSHTAFTLSFFKVHRTVLKIGKEAKSGEYVELKKTLVVGIFQQLYIEKALSIGFQGEKKKRKEKKNPQTPNSGTSHIPR